jgi:two-component system sensor histidine kinase KdpD
LNRLIGNLLNMARIESGHLTPKFDWADIRDVINASVGNLSNELRQHPMNITVDASLPLLRIDFGLVEQAIANLLYNAAVHTPDGTPITVEAKQDQAECIITVSDSGPGLPPGDLEKVFEKFYRVKGSVSGGTGLGLSIARGFTEANHGTLKAENQPSGGTRFIVRLPLELEGAQGLEA